MDVNARGRAVMLANPYPWFRHPQRRHAVSATLVARIPAYPGNNDWLRGVPPVAVVGHELYIYDIPASR